MENQNYPVSKHAFYYGIYTGLGLIVISLIFYLLDLYGEKWTSYISYLILLSGITLSSLSYRNNRLNGFITYGNSVSVGFLTGLFAAIIATIFTYVFLIYLGEDYIKFMLEQAEENILDTNPDISDEQLEMALNISKKMMKPVWISLIVLLSSTFFSLVFALIASIFIKKEEQ
ncbi:MAG: hypothetical protein B6D61_07515 [Bacteroidetes bacterium 4484_249]|nr:MAG: hypothetical protein B6D61_07515 [Bacteroidetes bacterium 4484_249]